MKNHTLIRVIDDTRQYVRTEPTDVHLLHIEDGIGFVISYCNKILEENPGISADELREKFIKDIKGNMQRYCEVSDIREQLYHLEAVKKLIGHVDEISKQYTQIHHLNDNELYTDEQIYNSNFIKCCQLAIRQALLQVRNLEQGLDEDTIHFLNKYKKLSERGKENLEQRIEISIIKKFKEMLPLLTGSYPERINAQLKLNANTIEGHIKAGQYNTMFSIGEFFKKINLLEVFRKRHSNTMKSTLGINLSFETQTNRFDSDSIGMEELFSKEFLEKEELNHILSYSSFLQNRFAKVSKRINLGLFAVDTLDLWEEIVKGNHVLNISRRMLKAIAYKEKCLEQLITNIETTVKETEDERRKKNKTSELQERDNNEFNEIVDIYDEQEGDNYKDIFNDLLPEAENNLAQDIMTYSILFKQIDNVYRIKHEIMGYMVRSLIDTEGINWGIIRKELRNGRMIDTLEHNNTKKVLIAIDYEGLNFPVRMHIDKNMLCDFMSSYNGRVIIPLYEGANDFIYGGNVVSTNMLMPFPKRHAKRVSDELVKTPEGTEKRNLLEHLQFLANKDRYPEHLMKKIISPSGVIKKKPETKYVDLLTGIEYIKDDNGLTRLEISRNGEHNGDSNRLY